MQELDFEKSKKCMMDYLKEFYPLQRMFNTPGLDKTFDRLKEDIPDIKIHEYEAGLECEDWKVPYNWEVVYGELKDENGNIIVSTEDNILFVNAYSKGIEGWFSKKEIIEHSLIHPTQKDVFMFQHRLAFNFEKEEWGVSMPQNMVDSLNDKQKYFVKIEVNKKNSPMKVADWFIKGEREDTICIAAHIDEQLCNDDLTGCVAGIELMKYIKGLGKTNYSYQLLLFSETIGSFIYLYHNKHHVRNNIKCMLNLEMLGAGDKWSLKHSLNKDSYFDKVLELSFNEELVDYKELEFFEGYENDERSFAWPTFDIPGVGIQRHPFKYYHTHKDNVDIIEEELLVEGLKISKNFIDILENDYTPKYTYEIPPKLSKHNLYFDSIYEPEKFKKFNNEILFSINGKNKISELAHVHNLTFREVYEYIEKFRKLDLIKKSI